jgi:hypothetical protein
MLSADAANIASGPCLVYWCSISNTHATDPTAVELMNGATDTGDIVWGINVEQGRELHAVFDPPLPFATGLTLDVTGGTPRITIGYVAGKP